MILIRFLLNLFMTPIHSFDWPWPIGTCKWCGHRTGLDGWQLESMPKEMAYCATSKKQAFRFKTTFNCWE